MLSDWSRLISKEWLIFWLCCLVLVVFYFSLGVTGPLFLIAWFAAYLTFPFVKWIQGNRFSRAQAVSMTLFIFIVVFGTGLALIAPWIYKESRQLIEALPGMI
jgi:predicted PurR-regulated permease PerM